MPGQAINVSPNTNTNTSTQSALSVNTNNSVSTQQPTLTNVTQSQLVTGAPTPTPTQTRTPAPLSVTGGEQFGIAQPSNFKSVSVTTPWLGRAADYGIGNSQDPINNKTFIPNPIQEQFRFNPDGMINGSRPIYDANGNFTGHFTGGGNPYENTTPVYLRR
jgi:hypothetical protein